MLLPMPGLNHPPTPTTRLCPPTTPLQLRGSLAHLVVPSEHPLAPLRIAGPARLRTALLQRSFVEQLLARVQALQAEAASAGAAASGAQHHHTPQEAAAEWVGASQARDSGGGAGPPPHDKPPPQNLDP